LKPFSTLPNSNTKDPFTTAAQRTQRKRPWFLFSIQNDFGFKAENKKCLPRSVRRAAVVKLSFGYFCRIELLSKILIFTPLPMEKWRFPFLQFLHANIFYFFELF
jgi:hypothetical protein